MACDNSEDGQRSQPVNVRTVFKFGNQGLSSNNPGLVGLLDYNPEVINHVFVMDFLEKMGLLHATDNK